MKLIYTAGAYRAANRKLHLKNIQKAEETALALWKAGYSCICPHANTIFLDGPMENDEILAGDFVAISRCDGVVLIPGWENSVGTKAEVRLAQSLGIPVFSHPRNLLNSVLVIGKAQSGKDTFCKQSPFGYRATSSVISDIIGYDATRPLKIAVGNILCDKNPSALGLKCLEQVPVVNGVRRRKEFDLLRPWFKIVVWVHAHEPKYIKDNLELTCADADDIIPNSGSAVDLSDTALKWFAKWQFVRNSE